MMMILGKNIESYQNMEENNDKSMQFLFYDAMCRKVSTKI